MLHEYPKLNDLWGDDWLTGGGVISTIATRHYVPWADNTDIGNADLDLSFHGEHSGEKIVAPLVLKMANIDLDDELSSARKAQLADVIWSRYGMRWEKLYETLIQTYPLIENYDRYEEWDDEDGGTDTTRDNFGAQSETHTIGARRTVDSIGATKETETRGQKIDQMQYGATQDTVQYGATQDTTQYGATQDTHQKGAQSETTQYGAKSGSTTYGATSESDIHGATQDTHQHGAQSKTEEESVQGFNSSTYQPSKKVQTSLGTYSDTDSSIQHTDQHTSEIHTDSNSEAAHSDTVNRTTYSDVDSSIQHSDVKSSTQHSDVSSSIMHTDQSTEGQQINTIEGDAKTNTVSQDAASDGISKLAYQDSHTLEHGKTGHHEGHIHGNIGVTTAQQMLTEQRQLWMWDYFEQIFKDIDSVLCLKVYA